MILEVTTKKHELFLLYINLRQRIGILFPEETSYKTRICALYFPFSWFVLYRGGSRQQIGCTVGVTFGKAEMSVKVKTVFGVFARSSCVFRELVANSGQIHLKTRSGEKANSGQIHKFNLLKQTSKASQTRLASLLQHTSMLISPFLQPLLEIYSRIWKL